MQKLYRKIDKIIASFLSSNPLKCDIQWQPVNCKRFTVHPHKEKDTVGMTQEISRYDREGREEPIHKIVLAIKGWSDEEILDTLGHELAHILIKEKKKSCVTGLGREY